jgi:hypothetical protein
VLSDFQIDIKIEGRQEDKVVVLDFDIGAFVQLLYILLKSSQSIIHELEI